MSNVSGESRHSPLGLILLISSVTLLVCVGMSMLYSTSVPVFGNRYLINQMIFLGIGVSLAFFLRHYDYRVLCRHAKWLALAVSLLLAYLAFANFLAKGLHQPGLAHKLPLVHEIKGAYRWIDLKVCSIQPSEFAKLALVLVLAEYFHRHAKFMDECSCGKYGFFHDYRHNLIWASIKRLFRKREATTSIGGHQATLMPGFLAPSIIVGIICMLIVAGGSLSVTLMTGLTVVAVFFVAGVRLRYFFWIGLVGVTFVGGLLMISQNRLNRVLFFTNPEAHQQDNGYQLWHSLLAIGSGGPTGLGFTESRMKIDYLPECHTDFIIAITAEELGFVAVAGIISCYFVLVLATLIIGARSRDFRGQLLCVGLGAGICCHALLNLAFVSGSMPTTGVTVPLISYGGSSLIATFIAIGLLLSVDRQSALARKEEEEPAKDNNTMTRSIPVQKELLATSSGRIPVLPKPDADKIERLKG